MDRILSFLLFAGLFYFMMRFGCCSHAVHGHRHSGHRDAAGRTKDPVCGMGGARTRLFRSFRGV
jgi:hypothetical protein